MLVHSDSGFFIVGDAGENGGFLPLVGMRRAARADYASAAKCVAGVDGGTRRFAPRGGRGVRPYTSICWRMALASAAGSAVAVMGRPTTM